MVIDIGCGKIDFNEENYIFLGDGCEANVYRYHDLALKLYKNNKFERKLDEEMTKKFKGISTRRIQLPLDIIYDEDGNMIGYTRLFKENYNHALKMITGAKLVEELKILREDAELLASCDIIISDLHRDNMIYDGEINLIDPGSYEKLDKGSNINPSIYNIESLNNLIINDIIGYDLEQFLSTKKASVITSELHKYSEYILDVIGSELQKTKTLRTYTRSLAKRH